MKPSAVVVLALTISMVVPTSPRVAHADEQHAPQIVEVGSSDLDPSTVMLPSRTPDVLALTADVLGQASRGFVARAPAALPLPSAHMGTDIRLSRGAKTAIIVSAIVVGILIIAGVIVIAKPHRP